MEDIYTPPWLCTPESSAVAPGPAGLYVRLSAAHAGSLRCVIPAVISIMDRFQQMTDLEESKTRLFLKMLG